MKKLFCTITFALLVCIGCGFVDSDPVTISHGFAYTASGDDGMVDSASVTQIRMARSADSLINHWDACTIISEHAPWSPGKLDSLRVDITVITGVDYFFAIKAADEVPNWSVVSDVITANFPDVTNPSPVGGFRFAY